ncbi:hypothetical protein BCR32DRAFT_279240 [Anaeromyces robustus]|uniref:Uncharacterized protein n=1 Tax=Anaeromyces robustus TaxID=1754192 RepID=A0A1Y1VQ13_9FUNG|nr:hypothetical protein BCR32DRAFT_298445 [Anaeromyces robustus]ORX82077.1 hypothetical protein BCR32DRAFT_279240 [Anaeromyces robustus]|eukprot:ORX63390.1 hypothetical protein BCR32DRAFT_298445 [Anaeromyces robustus]
MSFLYKPWTSEYQSQYTWKIRNQFRKPQDILEKQLEELKELQEENFKKLSLLEDSLKSKFIPEDDELYITEKKIVPKKETKEEELVLPKLSDDCNITKAENVEVTTQKRPSSSSSNRSSKSNKSNGSSKSKNASKNTTNKDKCCKSQKDINEQVEALISHYRRDGYGNNPWIGNKPTSFEYEKMKKFPSSKASIKNYDENLKLNRAKMYDAYRKEIDLRRLKQLFPYVNFDELNYNAQTQTYDDGIISGTYLSEYGSQYVNWNRPPAYYAKRFEKCAQKISENYDNNVGTSTVDDSKDDINETVNSLTKNVEKIGLEDEDLEICDQCNGYYMKKEKKSSTNNNSGEASNKDGDKIVMYEKQPPK